MCGRFTLRVPQNLLAEHFMLDAAPALPPRYNIAPTQQVFVIRTQCEGAMMRWGLIPSWAMDEKIGASLINARAETVAEKPSFRSAFKRRRCLVPADGYYEWLREGKTKQPHFYEVDGGKPFAMAGLWESWNGIETFTLITTAANELAAKVHDRMPVILSAADYDRWLSPDEEPDKLLPLLDAYPSSEMQVRPVSTHVNNARHEDAECLSAPA